MNLVKTNHEKMVKRFGAKNVEEFTILRTVRKFAHSKGRSEPRTLKSLEHSIRYAMQRILKNIEYIKGRSMQGIQRSVEHRQRLAKRLAKPRTLTSLKQRREKTITKERASSSNIGL